MSEVLTSLLLLMGGLLMLLAGVGMVRMPDLFMRMSASSKASTLGVACMLMAVAVHFGALSVTTRCLLVTAFVFLTTPVAAHMIARSAYSIGVPLWEETICDELRRNVTVTPGRDLGRAADSVGGTDSAGSNSAGSDNLS